MNIKHYIFVCLSLLALASCSEKDDTVEEYADWQNKNEQYFETAYLAHDYDFTLRKYSLGESATAAHTDYVLVKVLQEGSGASSPYQTDSVTVHYRGHLIPSTTYTEGYEFDKSYTGTFDEELSVPSQFAVSAVVAGFSTALQRMHRGDYWRVVIPYQLGYGTTDNSSIPAYSTLIFEMKLVDFWSKEKGDRE